MRERIETKMESQKGVQWDPREWEGVGLKILSAGRDSRKIAATPAL